MAPISPSPPTQDPRGRGLIHWRPDSSNEMKLNANQRRVLQLLEQAGAHGAAESLLRSNGATMAVLTKLVRAELAAVETAGVRSSDRGRRLIEVRRVRVTKAGRRELQSTANITRLPALLLRRQ
jgi:hypothetical protein